MHELGILFLHHRDDAITRQHYRLVREYNPEALLLPLTGHPLGHGLPNSTAFMNLENWDRRWQKVTENGDITKAWSNPDLAICQWYAQTQERAKRWVIMEWDTCCRMGWQDFWGELWDAPAAAAGIVRPDNPGVWPWFNKPPGLPEKYKPYATGMYLFGCMLLSDATLAAVTKEMETNYFDGFSELRFGTLCEYVGAKPTAPANYIGKIHHNSMEVLHCNTEERGIWHPVKNLPVEIDSAQGKIMAKGLYIQSNILPVEMKTTIR